VENDVLSTTEAGNLQAIEKQQLDFSINQLTSKTLTQILDECSAPTTFELLSIDAEEHDFQVLKSLNFDKYMPTYIVIEDETFEPASPQTNPIFSFLTDNHYKLDGYVLKNLYFVSTLKK